MSPVFADAGYWIALWNPADGLHQQALMLAERFASGRIVTTEMVLTEVFADFSRKGGRRREYVSRMVRGIRANAHVEIVETSSALFWDAVDLYEARPDQSWSLTDCSSFLVMERLGIVEALAYDRDFEQAGFAALLRGQSDQTQPPA